MTRYTADLCLLLSGNGTFSIHHALQILNQKVYCPKHDEIQQKFALRALISLAFVDDDALQYIELDPECTSSGPRNLTFVNAVEREMGIESDNPLLHVLRMAKLYRDKARTTSSVLAGRLSAQSALVSTSLPQTTTLLPILTQCCDDFVAITTTLLVLNPCMKCSLWSGEYHYWICFLSRSRRRLFGHRKGILLVLCKVRRQLESG